MPHRARVLARAAAPLAERVHRLPGGIPLIPDDISAATVQRNHDTIQEVRGRYDLLDLPSYAEKPGEAYGDLLFDLELAYYDVGYKRSIGERPSRAKLVREVRRRVRREPRVLQRLIGALKRGLPAPDDPTPDGPKPA